MQLPLRDMLWMMPADSSIGAYDRCWYYQSLSECMTGLAPSGSLASSMSSMRSCCAMSGDPDMPPATISLVQKPSVGPQYALPPATLNSVTSVPSFCHGGGVEVPVDDVGERLTHDPLVRVAPADNTAPPKRQVYAMPLSHGVLRNGKQPGHEPVPHDLPEKLGDPPPRPNVVLHPQVDTHNNLPFLMSKKWEAVHSFGRAF